MLNEKQTQVILKIAYANSGNAKDEIRFFNTLFEKQGFLNDETKFLFVKMLNHFQDETIKNILSQTQYTQFIEKNITWEDLLAQDIKDSLFHQLANYLKQPAPKDVAPLFFQKFCSKGKAIFLHLALELGMTFNQKDWNSKPAINKLIANSAPQQKAVHWALLHTIMKQDRSINPFKVHALTALELFSSSTINNFFHDKKPMNEKHVILKNEVLVNDKLLLEILDMLVADKIQARTRADQIDSIINSWLRLNDKALQKMIPYYYELIEDKSLIKDFIEKKSKYKKYDKVFNILGKYMEKIELEKLLLNDEALSKSSLPKKTMKI